MTPLLQLTDVCHAYGEGENRQPVLYNISFTLAAGEFAALVGQSGSGKSTLLNQVGLLEHALSGSIRLNGQEVTTLDDNALTRLRNEQLGFIFQFHHLLNAFTALENVMVPLKIRGRPEKALRERAQSLLARAGLSGLENRFPNQLSGGQQQRRRALRRRWRFRLRTNRYRVRDRGTKWQRQRLGHLHGAALRTGRHYHWRGVRSSHLFSGGDRLRGDLRG